MYCLLSKFPILISRIKESSGPEPPSVSRGHRSQEYGNRYLRTVGRAQDSSSWQPFTMPGRRRELKCSWGLSLLRLLSTSAVKCVKDWNLGRCHPRVKCPQWKWAKRKDRCLCIHPNTSHSGVLLIIRTHHPRIQWRSLYKPPRSQIPIRDTWVTFPQLI